MVDTLKQDGYTQTGWKKYQGNHSYTSDPNAFIFSLRSCKGFVPFISNIKKEKGDKALFYSNNSFCCFGGNDLWLDVNGSVNAWNPFYYDSFPNSRHRLGGKSDEDIKDFEIFELI